MLRLLSFWKDMHGLFCRHFNALSIEIGLCTSKQRITFQLRFYYIQQIRKWLTQVPFRIPTSDLSSGSLFVLQKVEEEEEAVFLVEQQQFLLIFIIFLIVVKLLFRRGGRIAEKEVSKSDHIPPFKPIRVRTGFSSEIGTKLRDWAVGQAWGSCYSREVLSSNESKTLY